MFESGALFAGRYEIVGLLGVGDVAGVYEVVDLDGARRALKVLKAVNVPLTAKLSQRLGREGEAIADIEHLNVVRYYASGIHENRLWLVLELVDGPNLRELLDQVGGALPIVRAVRIVRQACEGLAAAHKRGILHRDLKPENILIAEGDLTKVADFGSARLTGLSLATTAVQNLSSVLYSPPDYTTDNKAGPWSDAYAMGVILYELLTGENPFRPGIQVAIEITKRHMTLTPPPLATLGLGIPEALSDLARRALSKRPEERPSMEEMVDKLGVTLWELLAPQREAAKAVRLPGVMVLAAEAEAEEEKEREREPAAVGRGGTIVMAAVGAGAARSEKVGAAAGVGTAAGLASAARVGTGAAASSGAAAGSGGSARSAAGVVRVGAAAGGVPSAGVVSQGVVSGSVRSGAELSQGPVSRDASLPPAPSAVPTTRRSPEWAPATTAAMTVVGAGAGMVAGAGATGTTADAGRERGSTGVPVERAVSRPSPRPMGMGTALAVIGVWGALVAAGTAWWVFGGPAAQAPAGAAAVPGATATAAATATVSSTAGAGSARGPATAAPAATGDAGAPQAKASASVGPRATPPRGRQPFK
jgi:serine/threonine-protein kinase